MNEICPFEISISESELQNLNSRIGTTRWPKDEVVDDWSQGTPLAYLQDVCRYWTDEYDWRRCEAIINSYPQFVTTIDGVNIHFLHIRSQFDEARPLVMTHGWPGSIAEFFKVIGPLTDPTKYGGIESDAFHLVLPTMPGYGFSGKPTETGWGVERIGRAWGVLMERLGYEKYFAQGGDWGSSVTHSIAMTQTDHCAGAHVNFAFVTPSEQVMTDLTDFEQKAIEKLQYYLDVDGGYSKEQGTRPQTIGYSLVDSPVGLAAWIIEKFWAWTDNNGSPEDAVTRDEMLDNVMMYWLSESGASAARLYWESMSLLGETQPPIHIPFGVSVFPHDIFIASERWYRERCSDLRYFNILSNGGHFAATEKPEVFVDELRKCFAAMR